VPPHLIKRWFLNCCSGGVDCLAERVLEMIWFHMYRREEERPRGGCSSTQLPVLPSFGSGLGPAGI
jgi:hypothetical protein